LGIAKASRAELPVYVPGFIQGGFAAGNMQNGPELGPRFNWTFGSPIYKTFRRDGLHLLAGLIQPGGVHAVEGTLYRGRTHAVCVEAQEWGEYGFALPRVRHLPGFKKKINLSTSLAGQAVGIKEVDDGIWLVSFMDYDLAYIDLEEKTLQPLENPFGPKVLPMS
jgi:hypothetical protein